MKVKMNPEQLKQAMRRWITGVAIVTGHHEGAVHGMTANSFNSIALSPPTVLVALAQHTRTQHLVKEGGSFGVSILSKSQMNVAQRFAGQIDSNLPRFEGIDTFTLETGAPFIAGAMAYFDCEVVQSIDVGNTTVFLGEVLRAEIGTDGHEPLLYFNRQWRKLV